MANSAVTPSEGSVYSGLSDDVPAQGGFWFLKQYMAEDEFARAGLYKLSTEELKALQSWAGTLATKSVAEALLPVDLMTDACQSDYRAVKLCSSLQSEKEVRDCLVRGREGRRASSPPPSAATVIKSRIDGEFEEWEGDTIFKLENGQLWQQVGYHYHYQYAYAPEVMVVHTSRGWVMKVDGVPKTIRVEQRR